MSEITILHRLADLLIRQSMTILPRAAPLLDVPYRAEIHHQPDGQKVHISLPCGRYNWLWLPYAYIVFVAVPVVIAAIYWGIGIELNRYRAPTGNLIWSPLPLITVLVLLVCVFVAIMKWCWPRISIIATTERVTIGSFAFKWDELEGLRLGYSSGGKPRERSQWGFTGLRMQYGAWGYDLPYMVNSYYSAAYVVWGNLMLQTIEHVPFEGRVNSIEEGFQKDLF